MIEQHGQRWTVEWLRACRLHGLGEYLDRLIGLVETPADAILSVNSIPPFHTNGKVHQGRYINEVDKILPIPVRRFDRSCFGCWSHLRFQPARSWAARRLSSTRICSRASSSSFSRKPLPSRTSRSNCSTRSKNTTGGGAGVWQSNQNLLTNLGDLINQQEGLSYTFQGLSSSSSSSIRATTLPPTAGVQSPQNDGHTTLDTLNGALASAQAQAQNFQAETGHPSKP